MKINPDKSSYITNLNVSSFNFFKMTIRLVIWHLIMEKAIRFSRSESEIGKYALK